MVGRAFSTLGSLARVVQWRVEHAARIAEQSRLIAEYGGAAAAREAALVARIDALAQSLQVQAAMTSTVQRLAREEFEKTRQASTAAVAAKDDLESSLAEVLNAGTLNEVGTKALREEVNSLRDTAAVKHEATGRALAALENRIAESGAVFEARLAETAAGIEKRTVQRLAAVEQELHRSHAVDTLREELAVTRREVAGLEQELRRGHAVDTLREELAVTRREVLATDERAERAHAVAAATREELWKRAGALEGELSKRAQQVDEVQVRLGALASQIAALDIPTQVTALRAALEYVTNRVEFVRRETLLETRYGGTQAAQPTEPRIVNAAKVNAMGKALRLNVGCGHVTLPDYVNVDQRELPGVDVVAEAGNMPFAAGSVAELYSAHFLEHFPEERLRRQILPYFRSLLKRGGTLRAVVPDAETMIREYAAGSYSYAQLREVTFGGQDYEGDFHYNMFTPESLAALLREAGFSKVEVTVKGRRNGACYEFEVVAS